MCQCRNESRSPNSTDDADDHRAVTMCSFALGHVLLELQRDITALWKAPHSITDEPSSGAEERRKHLDYIPWGQRNTGDGSGQEGWFMSLQESIMSYNKCYYEKTARIDSDHEDISNQAYFVLLLSLFVIQCTLISVCSHSSNWCHRYQQRALITSDKKKWFTPNDKQAHCCPGDANTHTPRLIWNASVGEVCYLSLARSNRTN